jgi:hypothetical protein
VEPSSEQCASGRVCAQARIVQLSSPSYSHRSPSAVISKPLYTTICTIVVCYLVVLHSYPRHLPRYYNPWPPLRPG